MTDYTTHPDYRAMLAGIRSDKADDLKRLVLADWLEEHGQTERAEFIRVQCELASMPGYPVAWDHDAHLHVADLHRRQVWLLNKWDYGRGWRKLAGREAVAVIPYGNPWYDHFSFHRGFLHTVRGPLASLIGGECGRCGGESGYEYDSYRTGTLMTVDCPCPRCRGTGRTVGVLPALVRDGVVERVEVTDREPLADGGQGPWTWWRESQQYGTRIDPRSDLPDALFDALLRVLGKDAWWGGDGWTNHDTREAALSALSTALIAWAESEGEK